MTLQTCWVLGIVLAMVAGPSGTSSRDSSIRFAVVGDFGDDTRAERNVARYIKSWQPDFIVTAGDNAYGDRPIDVNIGKYYSEYIGSYRGQFGSGSMTNRFFPVLGNHDYTDGGGLPAYLEYFTLPGDGVPSTNSSGNERYYDIKIGPVHMFLLNSCQQEPDGITADSKQAEWLRDQLAASSSRWQLVCFHHPVYSSGKGGPVREMRWPFEGWGVDAVFTGHDHNYERVMQDDNGDGDSLAYFVNGLGGRNIRGFRSRKNTPGSTVRYNGNYGAMLVEATDSSLTLTFRSIARKPPGRLIDSLTIR